MRHRMISAKDRKKRRKNLKRRIVLVSMLFSAGVFSLLYVTNDMRRRDDRGGPEYSRTLGATVTPGTITKLKDMIEGRNGGEEEEAVSVYQSTTQRTLSSGACSGKVDNGGTAVLYIMGVLYCFLGLAIVCDEFFQTSLEIISEELKLTPDVAGATFLAAGSSAPELFTSLSDAFGDANSTGTGTIVGSAMFNILVIVALSAAVAGKNGAAINIDWRPVCRDVLFYSYSIVVLALVFKDGRAEWWEGLIMALSYCGYTVFMKYNTYILSRCQPPKIGITDEVQLANGADMAAAVSALATARRPSHQLAGGGGEDSAKVVPLPQSDGSKTGLEIEPVKTENAEALAAAAAAAAAIGTPGSPRKSVTLGIRHRVERRMSAQGGSFMDAVHLDATSSADAGSQENKPLVFADQNQALADEENGGAVMVPVASDEAMIAEGAGDEGTEKDGEKAGEDESGEDEVESRFEWPDKLPDQVLFVVGLPLLAALSITIPDCGRPEWRRFYVVSFLMSLLWIGCLTHYMVEWVTAVGCFLEVSAIFMGLVVLAIGTSVPDALGSMIAARSGEANMAIANAVGSNVFDVLIGLGVPWFLRGLIKSEPMPVDVGGIELNVLILFCTGLLFVIVLAVNGWSMNTKTGLFLFSLYIVYIVSVVVLEVA